MREYVDADLKMLEHLIGWNHQRGRSIEVEIKKQQLWVVSFLGRSEQEPPSLIAQFSGESEEVLDRWAKSIIWRYEKRKQQRS